MKEYCNQLYNLSFIYLFKLLLRIIYDYNKYMGGVDRFD